MALVPFNRNWLWEPWEEIDRFFNEPVDIKKLGFAPAVNVYEENEKIFVEAALTGINPENVEASIENNILILKGENRRESEVDDKNYYRHEVKTGSFYRTINLPAKVKEDQAQASYQNGILKIEIPKQEKNQTRKIEIKIDKKNN